MIAKALEVRDRATFIPVLAVDMNPTDRLLSEQELAERYLLRRAGYACDGRPMIVLTRLRAKNDPASYDPFDWNDGTRTFHEAHKYIIEHWAELRDGDVIDVEYILGETSTKKRSERLEACLSA